MISFKQYIIEVLSNENNSLFAIHPSGEILWKHSTPQNPSPQHEESFPSVIFTPPEKGQFTEIEKPSATAWGRVDHKTKTMHIVTHSGMKPSRIGRSHALENDVFKRISASRELEKKYPDYKIHYGYVGEHGVNREPRLISPTQYRKELLQDVYGDDSEHMNAT